MKSTKWFARFLGKTDKQFTGAGIEAWEEDGQEAEGEVTGIDIFWIRRR